jgi:hypothetical protein
LMASFYLWGFIRACHKYYGKQMVTV